MKIQPDFSDNCGYSSLIFPQYVRYNVVLPAIMFNSEERMEGTRKGRRAGSESRVKDIIPTWNSLCIYLKNLENI